MPAPDHPLGTGLLSQLRSCLHEAWPARCCLTVSAMPVFYPCMHERTYGMESERSAAMLSLRALHTADRWPLQMGKLNRHARCACTDAAG